MELTKCLWVYLTLLSLFLAVMVSGCVSLGQIKDRSDRQELAVTNATELVVGGNEARAKTLQQWIEEARVHVASSDTVRLRDLEVEIRSREEWDALSRVDTMMFGAILTEARERLEYEIGSEDLDEQGEVKLLTVFDWVEAAL